MAREQRAKAICEQLLRSASPASHYALKIREPHGIWGGLNEVERKQLLAQQGALTRGRCAPATQRRRARRAAPTSQERRSRRARTRRVEADVGRRPPGVLRPRRRGHAGRAAPRLGPGPPHLPGGRSQRIAAQGCRVCAPALPGFAGTPDLPAEEFTLGGYAALARRVPAGRSASSEKVVVVGHSFGGGVAIRFAHDHPERVRVARARELHRRARRGSGAHADLHRRAAAVGLGPALPRRHLPDPPGHPGDPGDPARTPCPNMVRNPRSIVQGRQPGSAGRPAGRAGGAEAARHAGDGAVGNRDGIIPKESFEAMCVAVGRAGPGRSTAPTRGCWPIPTPSARSSRTTSTWPSSPVSWRRPGRPGAACSAGGRRRAKLPSLDLIEAPRVCVAILRYRFGWLLLAALGQLVLLRRRPPHCGALSASPSSAVASAGSCSLRSDNRCCFAQTAAPHCGGPFC